MRSSTFSLFAFIVLTINFSCIHNDPEFPENPGITSLDSGEYFVFGKFNGFCRGTHCIEIFKLENKKLLKDTLDEYPNVQQLYKGKYIETYHEEFEIAKDLIDFIPDSLLKTEDVVMGCPDCADGGGLYIELKTKNIHKFWLIDQTKYQVPEYMFEFMDQVNEKINQLRTFRCELAPDVGPCDAAIIKYYYNKMSGSCQQFIWGGCAGVVPYNTMAECTDSYCDH